MNHIKAQHITQYVMNKHAFCRNMYTHKHIIYIYIMNKEMLILYIHIYIPGTQMTLVLNGKGLLLEGSNPKIEDKQVPGMYIYIYK